jgi:hypothetical protein
MWTGCWTQTKAWCPPSWDTPLDARAQYQSFCLLKSQTCLHTPKIYSGTVFYAHCVCLTSTGLRMSCFNYAWLSTRLPSTDFWLAMDAYNKLVRPQTLYIKLPKGSKSSNPRQPGRSAIENRQTGNQCTVLSAQRWPPMPLSNPLKCSTVKPGHSLLSGLPYFIATFYY